MIHLSSLTESDKGRAVVYSPGHGVQIEDGLISSWNGKLIFVLYRGDYEAKATYPSDLEFHHKKAL